MFVVFSIIAVSFFVSAYLFYRAEGLQRKLNLVTKEVKATNKSNQNLTDTMVMFALKNEESAVRRFNTLLEIKPNSAEDIALIKPLFTNYSLIVRELLKNNTQLKVILKKCCDTSDKNGFKNLTSYLASQDAAIKRLWSTNNLASYISLVEALLSLHEKMEVNETIENKKAG